MKLVENVNPENHWYLTFTQVNVDENLSNTLFTIFDREERVKHIMGIAKAQFQSIDETDCVIDLRDSNYNIIDDCIVTYQKMKGLADLLGVELKEPSPPELYLVK